MCELSGYGIDAEEFAVVAVHIGGDEPASGGVDVEVAGLYAASGLVSDEGKFPRGGIDGEDGDAFVPAIGGVDETSVGRDEDFGSPANFIVAGGQGVDDLSFAEGSGGGVVVVDAECGGHLVEQVDEASARMEGEVAGTGAGGGLDMAEFAGDQFVVEGVVLVDVDRVGAEIAHEGETVVR